MAILVYGMYIYHWSTY